MQMTFIKGNVVKKTSSPKKAEELLKQGFVCQSTENEQNDEVENDIEAQTNGEDGNDNEAQTNGEAEDNTETQTPTKPGSTRKSKAS